MCTLRWVWSPDSACSFRWRLNGSGVHRRLSCISGTLSSSWYVCVCRVCMRIFHMDHSQHIHTSLTALKSCGFGFLNGNWRNALFTLAMSGRLSLGFFPLKERANLVRTPCSSRSHASPGAISLDIITGGRVGASTLKSIFGLRSVFRWFLGVKSCGLPPVFGGSAAGITCEHLPLLRKYDW